MVKKKRKTGKAIKIAGISILAFLFGIAGWQVYSLVSMGVSDILSFFGIENPYLQGLILLIVIFIIAFLIFRVSFKKSLKEVFN